MRSWSEDPKGTPSLSTTDPSRLTGGVPSPDPPERVTVVTGSRVSEGTRTGPPFYLSLYYYLLLRPHIKPRFDTQDPTFRWFLNHFYHRPCRPSRP